MTLNWVLAASPRPTGTHTWFGCPDTVCVYLSVEGLHVCSVCTACVGLSAFGFFLSFFVSSPSFRSSLLMCKENVLFPPRLQQSVSRLAVCPWDEAETALFLSQLSSLHNPLVLTQKHLSCYSVFPTPREWKSRTKCFHCSRSTKVTIWILFNWIYSKWFWCLVCWLDKLWVIVSLRANFYKPNNQLIRENNAQIIMKTIISIKHIRHC